MRPGAFDCWGASHQIFHFLVVFATAVPGWGVRSAYDTQGPYHTCQYMVEVSVVVRSPETAFLEDRDDSRHEAICTFCKL